MARSDGLESSHASPFVDFLLRARSDYHSRSRRSGLFVLLGIPSLAALALTRHVAAVDLVVALAGATTATPVVSEAANCRLVWGWPTRTAAGSAACRA
jgi:hypothetical protein